MSGTPGTGVRRLAVSNLKLSFGSLVSISEYSTVGNLMGGALGGNLYFQGYLARLMYISLHKMHDLALHGFWKVGLDTVAGLFRRTHTPVKLH